MLERTVFNQQLTYMELVLLSNCYYKRILCCRVGAACWTADTTAPSTPASLTASGTTSTTTNLSWTAATDNVAVTGYNVYRGTSLLYSYWDNVCRYRINCCNSLYFTVKQKMLQEIYLLLVM
jgi:hypothetical protein